MSLHKLVFDTTSAATIADSHSVGAYLRASDGTLLTHTDVGGKKALDVRVAEGINVEVDLTFAEDSVDVSGSIVALDAGTLAALETITVLQGTDPWVVGDGGGSLTVDAVDLDIRDLAAATDAVSAWTKDGAGTAITSTVVGPDTGLDVNVIGGTITVSDAALANTAIAADALSLTAANTAEDLIASPLANRKYLWVYNNDNRVMYIGPSGVSAADGFPIPPGAYMALRAGAAVDIEWVSEKLNHAARYMELS